MNEYKFTTGSDEMMLQYPNGRVQFLGTWKFFLLAFHLVRDKKANNVVYLDGERIN